MIVEVGIILLLAAVRIDSQADCTGLPDGACCAGCHSYTQCIDGQGTHIDCDQPDFVYNELIGACDSIENTPPPCGYNQNCTGLPDGRYPDMTVGQECEYFFTCLAGLNQGKSPCNPPDSSDLVWDYYEQTCNWRHETPPPCGTDDGITPAPRF